MIETRKTNLRRLNSATKYPSIPTYHSLGEKGRLLDSHVEFDAPDLLLTEKVDGTNSRIIFMPDGYYLIGSREELLHAKGDLIHNPAMGIVDALRSVADTISEQMVMTPETITTIYLETYGGKTTAGAKQYTGHRAIGYRMFDVSVVPVKQLEAKVEEISTWRESGGQQFKDEVQLAEVSRLTGIGLTPRIESRSALPASITETQAWLETHLPSTLVALDEQAGGRAEGIVVRTSDRRVIAKIRFEDYRRHARLEANSARR